jgi:hypothetical protein
MASAGCSPSPRATRRPWSAAAGSSCPTERRVQSHDQAPARASRHPDLPCAPPGRCSWPSPARRFQPRHGQGSMPCRPYGRGVPRPRRPTRSAPRPVDFQRHGVSQAGSRFARKGRDLRRARGTRLVARAPNAASPIKFRALTERKPASTSGRVAPRPIVSRRFFATNSVRGRL